MQSGYAVHSRSLIRFSQIKTAERHLAQICSSHLERERSRILIATGYCSLDVARPGNKWPASRGDTRRIEAFGRRKLSLKRCSLSFAACLWLRHAQYSKQRIGEHCTALTAYNIGLQCALDVACCAKLSVTILRDTFRNLANAEVSATQYLHTFSEAMQCRLLRQVCRTAGHIRQQVCCSVLLQLALLVVQ